MKKYLLIYNDMKIGGIEKSIISLLNSIDYTNISVDLFLLRAEGEFLSQIPTQVNVIDCKFYYDFSKSRKEFFSNTASWSWRGRRLIYALISRASKIGILYKGAEVSYKASLIPRLKKIYDVAIAYVDWSFDYASKYVKANKKYYYIHVDYNTCINFPEKDRKIFPFFESGFAVSEDSCEILKKVFPECKDKIHVLPNIVPQKLILDLAKRGECFNDMFDGVKLLTVCRASYEKGVDIAIETCAILKKNKVKFRWYYIGTGVLLEKLKQKVLENELQEDFVFLGEKSNPYGFFENCDIYVQCSRNEGYGITLSEAAVFGKPRVVSDIKVFKEQIENGKNGILADVNAEDFSQKLEFLINDKVYYSRISSETKRDEYKNSEAVDIFYAL